MRVTTCRANAELIVAIANPKDGRTLRDFVERVLLALCDEMTKLIDHPDIAEHSMGTAMMKLFNALANYRIHGGRIANNRLRRP